jgi:hypothetical protein
MSPKSLCRIHAPGPALVLVDLRPQLARPHPDRRGRPGSRRRSSRGKSGLQIELGKAARDRHYAAPVLPLLIFALRENSLETFRLFPNFPNVTKGGLTENTHD